MSKTDLIYMIGVAAMAVVDFVIYTKMTKYLFTAAGVTKEDAQKYRMAHQSTNKNGLIFWLRNKTTHPKEFDTIHSFCLLFSFLFSFSAFILFISFLKNNILILQIYFVVSLWFTVIGAIFGFLYGKRIESECEGCFSSSEYVPYEPYDEDGPEYIESTEELYKGYNDKVHRRNPLSNIKGLIIPIIILLITFGTFIILDNKINENYIENDIEPTNIVSDITEPSIVIDENAGNAAIDPYTIYNKLLDEGFDCYNSFQDISTSYPQYDFDVCIQANNDGVGLSCYVLTDGDAANELCNTIVSDLIEIGGDINTYSGRIDDAGFTTYYRERNDGYLAVIYSENCIVLANCDELKAEWLKGFLYENGFLESF